MSFKAAGVSARTIHYCRMLDVSEEEDLPWLIRRMVENALKELQPYQTSRLNRKTVNCLNCNTPGHVQRNCNMMSQSQGFASECQPLWFNGFREQGLADQNIRTPRITTPFRELEQNRKVQGKIGAGSYRVLLDRGAKVVHL